MSSLSFPWLPWIFSIYLLASPTTSTAPFKIPRLRVHEDNSFLVEQPARPTTSDDPSDYKTFYFNQTLDHFNFRPESYNTFQQRYIVNCKYWGGANANSPIFAYLGAEVAIDIRNGGFLPDNAPDFSALCVYIEHRYYGESIPFGSIEEAFKNASTLGYFNSAQALADYASILIHLKNEFQAENSPVIVLGESYGGMLAAWFRLKYPHVAFGALASSAPILYFDDITPYDGFYLIVTKVFKEFSESCYEIIVESWSEIDRVASQPDGLSFLSDKFNTCRPLTYASDLTYYLESMYWTAAQYNNPPNYPVTKVCKAIDGAPDGSDILTRIVSGVVAYYGNKQCYLNLRASENTNGWSWQRCSDMVMPLGRNNDTMFPPEPFNLTTYIQGCINAYGVPPRPHWVTSYYGGHDIKSILGKFGSNIIFSNGLKDPYSCGGVLENISDSIVAVYTTNGAHCLDLVRANQSSDPQWLVEQRQTEVAIIKGWLFKYYDNLHATMK